MATFVESEDADEENVEDFSERKAEVDETFSVKTWAEDLTLIVEGRKLYVSKAMLAVVSPVFRKMFEGEYQSKNEITLHQKKYADVVEFLHCVYPNPKTLRDINEDNVMSIFPLILEFDVELEKEKCESLISEIVESLDTVEELLQHFLKFSDEGLFKLKEQCLSLLVKEDVADLKEDETFCALPTEVKNDILIKMAEYLTERVNGQEDIISEQRESIENHQLFRQYFLSFKSKYEQCECKKYSYCRVIEYEFVPGDNREYVSDYISLGNVKIALVISRINCRYLLTDLRFNSEKKYAVNARFILVNHFSAKDDHVEETCTLPKRWQINWDNMIDESQGFKRDGKVKFIAYVTY